ncbi:hypothetical protein IJT10_08305 [bacterium]|nr:hypothetical protein [bacterium]
MLSEFYQKIILSYLQRELSQCENWQVTTNNYNYLLSWSEKNKNYKSLQLRFSQKKCLWQLYKRGSFRSDTSLPPCKWIAHQPDRPCLSLGDWLGQVRKLITKVI